MADPLAMRTLRQEAWKTRRLFRLPTFNRWADDWLKHWRGRQRSNAKARRPFDVYDMTTGEYAGTYGPPWLATEENTPLPTHGVSPSDPKGDSSTDADGGGRSR